MRLVSRMVFGRVFNGFWKDLKRILEGFWGNMAEACQVAALVAELTMMIRATRGRSMDGEVLIIGMTVGWSGWVPKGLVSGDVI